jgi:hypothetical protein
MPSTPLLEIKVPPEEGPLRWWWWPGGWILFLRESGSGTAFMYCEGPPGDTDWGGVANLRRANKQKGQGCVCLRTLASCCVANHFLRKLELLIARMEYSLG